MLLRDRGRPSADVHPEGKMLGPWEDGFLLLWHHCSSPELRCGCGAHMRPVSPGLGGGCWISGIFPGRLPALTKTTQTQDKGLGPKGRE